ncbi:uncharacterized protein LOC112092710 [Morus notabilis]|uniref:uncharacterized protein LOC112092710 n=1 Tax=Morus notabilis TaxID=981085 RepID=UPI000CED2008|nr:uncharacterized protein LOC112092710 [Morus notabilis]
MGQFSSMATEDPHIHLRQFIEVSDAFKLPGVTKDTLRLKLFPYSLRDKARVWLNSLLPDSVASWDELAEKFLMKYFPPTKNAKLRNDITLFQQADGESLYEAWDRFKELLRKCPHHGIPHWIQMETFYNGLNGQTRTIVDAAAGGAILAKSYNDAYEILERMANNNYQWPTERHNARKATGIHEVDAITALSAQMSGKGVEQSGRDSHQYEDCPSNPAYACYVANFNTGNHHYSNPHNQGMRQHPNLSWSNLGASTSQPNAYHKNTYPPRYPPQQQRTQAVEQSSSLESLLKEFISRSEAKIQSHDAALRNLENQVGHISNSLNNRPQGSLSSNTKDPRRDGKEHCKAITLRCGKELESKAKPMAARTEPTSIQGGEKKTLPQEEQPRNVLKQLHINIPLVEALEKMPNYAKFMKDLVTKKRRFGEFETVALTEECSAILQNKLPPKLKDPGSFTIPCSIGNQYFGKALCDLGASINLMPMSIFKKLGIGEAWPTTVSLQLADRSIALPE